MQSGNQEIQNPNFDAMQVLYSSKILQKRLSSLNDTMMCKGVQPYCDKIPHYINQISAIGDLKLLLDAMLISPLLGRPKTDKL